MTLATDDIGRLLIALALLLSAAHGLGYVFARFRQPRVIGEILGGLLLGLAFLLLLRWRPAREIGRASCRERVFRTV